MFAFLKSFLRENSGCFARTSEASTGSRSEDPSNLSNSPLETTYTPKGRTFHCLSLSQTWTHTFLTPTSSRVSILSSAWQAHGAEKGCQAGLCGSDLIKTFPSHSLGHWKSLLILQTADFQGIRSRGWNWVCVTLSCSQGFPLPSPHPKFTSGIGPDLCNRSQCDSKV